jgi:RHS repeat-associated protein
MQRSNSYISLVRTYDARHTDRTLQVLRTANGSAAHKIAPRHVYGPARSRSPRRRFLQVVQRGPHSLRAFLLGAVLLCFAPLVSSALAQSGTCTSIDPPCPPPPPLAVSVQSIPDTMRYGPVNVFFSVTGITPGTRTVTATVGGTGAASPTYTMGANGNDATGSVLLTLNSGTHSVAVSFCVDTMCATDATTVVYSPPPAPPTRGQPIAVLERGSAHRRNLVECSDCANAELSYSTPAYRSRDQDRSLTLIYSSALSAPMGQIVLDVDPNSSETAAELQISLQHADQSYVTLWNGARELFFRAGQGQNRITALFDASSFATGLYSLNAIARNWYYGGGTTETPLNVNAMIVNQRNSGFGSGWTVKGLQTYHMPNGAYGDAMFVEDGHVTVFKNCGPFCWTPPPGEPSAIRWNSAGLLQRQYRDSSAVEFGGSDVYQTAFRNRFGEVVSYEYDLSGRLTKITDPAGLVTQIAYTGVRGSAGTATITTPGGRTTVMSRDNAGQLTTIVGPDGVQDLGVVYSNNRIVTATDRSGATVDYAYDRFGSLASVTGPAFLNEGSVPTRITTTVKSRQVALLDSLGFGYFGLSGVPIRRVIPDSVWTTTQETGGSKLAARTNGAGDATTLVTTDALGKADTTTIGYGIDDRPASVRSSAGAMANYTWQGGLISTVEDLVSHVFTRYSRNVIGQVDTVTVNGTVVEKNTHGTDRRSLLVSSTSGNATTNFTYDSLGRTITATDGAGHQTSFTYLPTTSQNIATITKDGKTTQFAYDVYGRLATAIDNFGQTTALGYDLLNRNNSTTAPGQGTSTWSFDDANRTAVFHDAAAQTWGTRLNAVGAPMERWGPANSSLRDQYRYDDRGNLSSFTTRAGRNGQLQHDALGRVTQIAADAAPTTSIAYDSSGKWVAYSNSESVDTVFVDGTGRVTRQATVRSGTSYDLTSTFGVQGNRQKLNVTSSAWSGVRGLVFDVDSIGRSNYVGDFSGTGTSIAYNQDHQPQVITLPTGAFILSKMYLSRSYLPNERIENASSSDSPGLLNWTYQYDGLDRTIKQERGVPPYTKRRNIEYDSAGRVVHWTDTQKSQGDPIQVCDDPMVPLTCHTEYPTVETVTAEESRSFDLVGNRTDGNAVTAAGDRLMSFNGYTLTYDADGNVLTKSGNGLQQSFTWNGLGQLASVTTNGMVTSFGYDGLGRRVRKTVNGVSTRYLYDGDNLAMQLDASGIPQLEFSYYPGIDNPHAVRQSSTGNLFFYITNGSGDVVALVNKSKQVVNTYEYKVGGQAMTVSEQLVQPLRFAAREFDAETGLYYDRARYYDPSLTRFLSEDPIGLAGGINPYVFADNDPVNKTDPSGLGPCSKEAEAAGWQTISFEGGGTWCYMPGGGQELEGITIYGWNPANEHWHNQWGNSSTGAAAPGLSFIGFSGSLYIGVGGSVSLGVYRTGDRVGFYGSAAGGPGLGLGLGVTGGYATSRAAFFGASEGGCAGVIVEACQAKNASGTVWSVSGGLGSELIQIFLPVHVEASYTRSLFEQPAFTGCYGAAIRSGCHR